MKTLIPVVLYLRMSSDKQECSIDDQRKELTEHCRKHGYRIVREYIDEGISGWKGKERLGFQELIADATKREFEVVVCWDQSRFSRFSPVEANYYWHILQREEIRIETIKEGRLDLDSLGGWLTASISQHGKAEYVKSLAHDVARGQRRQRQAGYWIAPAPYGYRKPEGKNVHLVLGPAEEVEAVRKIFALRVQGYGQRGIAMVLNDAGIKSPHGNLWAVRQIANVLTKQTYIGDSVSGNYSRPQFASKNPGIEVKGTHPPIIDKATWDEVQKLNGVRRDRHGSHGNNKRHEGGALAGLLHCGQCGSLMYYQRQQKRYVCGAYHSQGQCTHNTVPSGPMLSLVASKIREVVLMGSLDKLTVAVEKALVAKKATAPKIDAKDIQRQIQALEAKLAKGAERIMSVVPSLVASIAAGMLDCQRQIEALKAKLTEDKPVRNAKRTAKDIAGDLWRLDEVLRKGSPTVVRFALSKHIKQIDVQFLGMPSKTRGKRRTSKLHYRPDSAAIRFTNACMPSGLPARNGTITVKLSKEEMAAAGMKVAI